MQLRPLELPSPERQERLLAGLGNLVRRRGPDALVAAPVLLPTNKYFPDAWSTTLRGIKRLIRRLMCYAELPDLRVSLRVYHREDAQEVSVDGQLVPTLESTAAAWFGGIDGDQCWFGLDIAQLDDPEQLVGTLCHEVAHAYRTYHALRVPTTDVEEALTDLTTIYLGFGVLTTNNAYRYRSSGQLQGAFATFRAGAATAGYLDAGEMSFLLAAQAAVRATSAKSLRVWTKELEVNQRELFELALTKLREDESLLEVLALPDRDAWPRGKSLEQILAPLDDEDEEEAEDDDDLDLTAEPDKRTRSAGRNTFRVLCHRGSRGAWIGSAVGFPFSIVAFGLTDGMLVPIMVLFVGGVAGFFAGTSYKYTVCSDPMCEAVIGDGDKTCPGCGARVRGIIARASDRLAAEEDLEDDGG